MKSLHFLLVGFIAPCICVASPQSATDLQTTVQQRIGKRVEIRRDPGADEEIERAVQRVLRSGYRTADLYTAGMKLVGTQEMGRAVAENL